VNVIARRVGLAALALILLGPWHAEVAAQSSRVPNAAACGRLDEGGGRAPQPYNPARLVAIHDCLVAHYDPRAMVFPLEKAGVATLLAGPGGLPDAQRIEILNDYGLWLGQERSSKTRAVAVLTTVLRLAPDRAAAWLELADVYRAELSDADVADAPDGDIKQDNATWDGKVRITKLALDAYQHYVALVQKPVPRATGFIAFNILNAPTKSPCAFVAAFANAHREAELYTDQMADQTPVPVDLLGDGKKYLVYIRSEGGAAIPAIYIASKPPGPLDYYPRRDKKFPFGADFDERQSADEYHLMAMNGKYYFVHDAWGKGESTQYRTFPSEVLDPTGARVCGITTKLTPKLTTSVDDKLCDDFMTGVLDIVKILIPPPQSEDHLRDSGFSDTSLTGALTIDLQNDGVPMTVASFDTESHIGYGCSHFGLTLFDGDTGRAIDSPLNKQIALIPQDCSGGSTNLIRLGKKTYIESERGDNLDPGEAKGIGIYEATKNQVATLCEVDSDATFIPE
jgi:hypothetical protein